MRNPGHRKKLLSLVWVMLCLLVCCACTTLTLLSDLRDWQDSDTWAATPSSSFSIQSKTSQVRYTYVVDGQTYHGRQVRFFEWLLYSDGTDLEWQHTHRDVPVVTVYYDPEQPERAVLVREVEQERVIALLLGIAYAVLVIGGPLLLFGAFWWWWWRTLFGRKRSA